MKERKSEAELEKRTNKKKNRILMTCSFYFILIWKQKHSKKVEKN